MSQLAGEIEEAGLIRGLGLGDERTAMLRALAKEEIEDVLAPVFSQHPISGKMKPLLDSIAAEVVDRLPVLPAAANLSKTQFRQLATQSIRLVKGGDGLIASFVETMVDLNAKGFENRMGVEGKANQDFTSIFNTFCRTVNSDPVTGKSLMGKRRGMDTVLKQFVWQWWTTGLVVVLYRWGNVPIPKLNSRQFQIPIEMEILDPLRIDMDELRLKGIIYYEFPDAEVKALQDAVKRAGGPEKHPLFAIYPKNAKQLRAKPDGPQNVFDPAEAYKELQSKKRIPLPPDSVMVVKRGQDPSEIYPYPFPARMFASVSDKQMLRAMDRSLISKVIMMILQISVASPDARRPVRRSDLEATRAGVEEQLQTDPEYLQIVTTVKETLIQWITPDQESILDEKKYRTIDREIFQQLIGLIANTLLNNNGQIDLSMLGQALHQRNQSCLMDFRRFLEELYDEIIVRSKIKAIKQSDVNPVFKTDWLFQPDSFKVFVRDLVARGVLPARVAIDYIGEDFQTIVEYHIKEQELRKQHGIFLVPPTNNQITDNNVEDGDTSGPGGRPPGTPESEPREETE